MRAIRLLIAMGLLVALVLLAVAYYGIFLRPSPLGSPKAVIVVRGASFHEIADELARNGIIESAFLFRAYAKAKRADTDVHAGEFQFAPHQTQAQILDRLQSGGAQIAKWVTFPEGFTARQIAARLGEAGFGSAERLAGDFLRDSIVVGGSRTKNLEGYLFPSSYLIPISATPKQIETMFETQFRRALPVDAVQKARRVRLSVPQVVTVASLVQQEGKADDERPLIASVIYNRLRLGMPLEVDATLEYAFAQHHSVITYGDLKTESPYNTYKHQGLPPTPIANPGEPSIRAAFNPRQSDFLYYVYKGDGHSAFARTLQEHNANVRKYLK